MKVINLNNLPDTPVSHDPNIKKKLMIGNGQIPHLTNFSQATFKPGQKAEKHKHLDMYEVFLIEQGIANFKVNDQEIEAGPGTCVIVEPNDTHEVENSTEENLILTYFGIEVKLKKS